MLQRFKVWKLEYEDKGEKSGHLQKLGKPENLKCKIRTSTLLLVL